MSLDYEKGLFVRIVELEQGPHPRPLAHGFSEQVEYRVLGMYNPSESGECWLILANDRDEIWYISQRHVRVSGLRPFDSLLRVKVAYAGDSDVDSCPQNRQTPVSTPEYATVF